MSPSSLAAWATPRGTLPDVEFAHIKLDERSARDRIWSDIALDLGPTGSEIWFVGTKQEQRSIISGTTSHDVRIEKFDFLSLVSLLKSDRIAPGDGTSSAWRSRQSNVSIAFMPNDHMSADCALALVAVTHWASQVSGNHAVRILILSPRESQSHVVKLLSLYRLPPLTTVLLELRESGVIDPSEDLEPDVSEPSQNLVTISPRDFSLVTDHLLESLSQAPGSHVVVFFEEFNRLDETIKHLFEQAEEDANPFVFHRLFDDDYDGDVLRNAVANIKGSKLVVMQLSMDLPSPHPLSGFDNIHVVVSRSRYQKQFDHLTGQLSSSERNASQDEIDNQFTWGNLVIKTANRVTYYVEREEHHDDDHEFLKTDEIVGDERWDDGSRWRISQCQLGGLMTALAALTDWGIDVESTLRCLVPVSMTWAVIETRNRLLTQRLLSWHGGRYLRLSLKTAEAQLFDSCLPLVDYDHRVAHFLARISGSARVMRVKAQLAALLTVGLSEVLNFHDPRSLLDPTPMKPSDSLVSQCHGYGASLAKFGTLWLTLGLWKMSAMSTQEFQIPQIPRQFQFQNSSTSVNIFPAAQALGKYADLVRLMEDSQLAYVEGRSIALEARQDLSVDQYEEIQMHLLLAYSYQLVGWTKEMQPAEPHLGNAEGLDWQAHDVSTESCLKESVECARTHDLDAVIDRESEVSPHPPQILFGICHKQFRGHLGTYLSDWTHIPTGIVAGWQRSVAGDMDIHQFLHSPLPPRE